MPEPTNLQNLIALTKTSLSIDAGSTLKDTEIENLIKAAIKDLTRQGIQASVNTEDELTKTAIILFVKGNFGNVDIKEKQLAQNTYSLLCQNLGLSEGYEVEE